MCNGQVVAIKHVEDLAVKIGPRPLGSKTNQAAAEYIQGVFKASGLEVDRQEFPCPTWEDLGTRLEFGGQRYVAAANVFSPACHVVAPLSPVGTIVELEQAELAGRVALFYGDLTGEYGYSARSGYYFPERDRRVYGILEEKRPVAVITIQPQVGSLQRLISDWEFCIPSATVPAEVGLRLRQHKGHNLELKIESRATASRFCNVSGIQKNKRQEKIVVCAHLDTMTDAPGALDNGSGVAVLLTLAETLTKQESPLSLEFVALNGHENGSVGVAEYLRRKEHELAQVLVLINVDGVGQTLGTNSVAVFAGSPALQEQVAIIRRQYAGMVQVEPWYESDHTAFFTRGVPSLAFSSIGVTNIMHRPLDTLEWISPEKLGEVISFVTDFVEGLQDKPVEWCRD
ncbi:MAG: M28 family peptidase [Acidobacteriota bacterium]